MSRKPRKTSTSAPDLSGLQLGRAVAWPSSPDQARLDRVPNPQRHTNYLVPLPAP